MKNPATLLVCAGLLQFAPLQGHQDVTSTLITQTVEVGQPLAPCEAADVVALIARVTGVPAGIEFVPGDCEYRDAARSATRQSLQGLSVREALDQMVVRDPRYGWQLLDGVVSFRPVAAANQPKHFLHTATGDLQLVDDDMAGALAAITAMLGAKYSARPPALTPLAEKRFSVSRSSVSAVAALDAVVRAHGAMWWEVRYCKPDMSRHYATVNLWTFDKGGVGYRLDQSFRASKAPDPCLDTPPVGR
jgi:hypothetical protein